MAGSSASPNCGPGAEYGGRALRNRFFDHWVGHEEDLWANAGATKKLAASRDRGDYDTAVIFAGQGVTALDRERLSSDVLAELAGARSLLKEAASQA